MSSENTVATETTAVAEVSTHPLQTPWSFWYSKKTSGSSASAEGFSSSLKHLGTFETIEGFMDHYSYLKRPADLNNNCNYHLFRDQTRPAWESFSDGGCWTLRLKRHSPYLARFWEELLFACIGELWDEPKVVGVVVSTRPKGDAVSVWTSDGKLKSKIGEKIRKILQLEPNTPMEYKPYPH